MASCVVGLTALAGGMLGACRGSGPEPTNVLIYTVDTLRADSLACYGNERVSTPNFDRLAHEGVRFPDAFANASWTRASMATLFTGLDPLHHGVQGRDDALPESIETLGDRLQAHGYDTAFITANPNVGSAFGFGRGFGEMIELYARRDTGLVWPTELIARSDEITERAIAWLGHARRPFYLAILTVDPHAPYAPPARFDRYAGDDAVQVTEDMRYPSRSELDESGRRRSRALYDGEVSSNDDSFGRLIEYLRETGELDDTLVVLTSDHGEEFWEYGRAGHGRSLADPVLHIPLILRLPAGGEAPPAHTGPVALVDVLPTVLDVLSIEANEAEALDGHSLLADSRDPAPIWASLHLDGYDLEALRTEHWKLVWDQARGSIELFDLARRLPEADPVEVESHDTTPFKELRRELLARLSSGRARQSEPAPEKLPDHVEDALRALGYVE